MSKKRKPAGGPSVKAYDFCNGWNNARQHQKNHSLSPMTKIYQLTQFM
jgi:hypothetical protein